MLFLKSIEKVDYIELIKNLFLELNYSIKKAGFITLPFNCDVLIFAKKL